MEIFCLIILCQGFFFNLAGLLFISYGFPFWASMSVLCVSLSAWLCACHAFSLCSLPFFFYSALFLVCFSYLFSKEREKKRAVELDGEEVG